MREMHQGAVMKIIKNDEAVSPVIGVILMVAITVILAAVIAAFVFGMAGSGTTSKNVGLTIKTNTTGGVLVTVSGGADLPKLDVVKFRVNGVDNVTIAKDVFAVGDILYGANTDYKGSLVAIVGKFDDGSEQVLLEKQF